jgi:glycosyltransferase involved in cell wall biosynthesis
MSKKRILMSGPLPPNIGGMVSVIEMIAQSSLAHRYELTLFDTSKKTPINRTLLQGIRARLSLMSAWWQVVKKTELVHIHTCSGLTYFLDSLLMILAQLRGIPVLLHIHGARFDQFIDQAHPAMQWWVRWTARRANTVIVLSEHWYQQLSFRLPKARLEIVENGMTAIEGSHDRMPQPTSPQFLFLGSLETRKGVDDLLQATAQAQQHWQLILAGHEGQAGYLQHVYDRIAQLQISERVQVLGPIIGAEKNRWLTQASGFVLPSYAEGLPIALLEAMAAGLPVVVSAVGAMPEVVHDGEEGFMIAAGDVTGLAHALDQLAISESERVRMGRCAQATCLNRYSVERMIASLTMLIERAL